MTHFFIYIARVISRILDAVQLRICHRLGYESQWCETSVGRIHALCYQGGGELPPLLLVHGLSSSAQDFEPMLRQLRGPFRQVIAIDLIGHGLSFRGETTPSADILRTALAEAAAHFLDEPAVVYGNSLGGYASLILSLDRPDIVRALLLSSPGGAPLSDEQMKDILGVFNMRTHRDAMAFMARIMETRSWRTPLMAQACLGRLSAPHMAPMLAKIARARLLRPEDIAKVSVPTVVMWGQGERLFPKSALQFFQDHLPEHTQFEFPDGAGHVPHGDRPDLVSRRLRGIAELVSR